MGEALNEANLEIRLHIAAGDQLQNIINTISYLAARKHAAERYFKCESQEVLNSYIEYIEFCNEKIKAILGI